MSKPKISFYHHVFHAFPILRQTLGNIGFIQIPHFCSAFAFFPRDFFFSVGFLAASPGRTKNGHVQKKVGSKVCKPLLGNTTSVIQEKFESWFIPIHGIHRAGMPTCQNNHPMMKGIYRDLPWTAWG
jgi:hypothetical protein